MTTQLAYIWHIDQQGQINRGELYTAQLAAAWERAFKAISPNLRYFSAPACPLCNGPKTPGHKCSAQGAGC